MALRVLKSGARCIQYRNKETSRKAMYEEALKIREFTKEFNAVFIVNDFVDITRAVGADGVHLGQDDLPLKEARKILGKDKIIGISTHNMDQAIEAEKNGADYLGFGPVFYTTTKNAGSPKGTEILGQVTSRIRIPVVAIGGINLDNVRSVFEAGADAVAIASAILSGDIEENTRSFMEIISPGGKPS
jgi:thiamine-phosphate pyrophosphorylase